MNDALRRVRRTAFGIGGAALLTLSGIGAASAHVTVKADETAAGSYALLTVAFSHGCEGSATTEIAISVPEEITSIAPGMNYGWTVEKIADDSATPATDEEGEAVAPVTEIVYTAKEPVQDGFYEQFILSVQLPEDAEGETIYFPIIQTCEEGEIAWVQMPEEGQSSDDLDAPAPSITVTAPDEDGGGH
jgi:uncharacterized protein YcnI